MNSAGASAARLCSAAAVASISLGATALRLSATARRAASSSGAASERAPRGFDVHALSGPLLPAGTVARIATAAGNIERSSGATAQCRLGANEGFNKRDSPESVAVVDNVTGLGGTAVRRHHHGPIAMAPYRINLFISGCPSKANPHYTRTTFVPMLLTGRPLPVAADSTMASSTIVACWIWPGLIGKASPPSQSRANASSAAAIDGRCG